MRLRRGVSTAAVAAAAMAALTASQAPGLDSPPRAGGEGEEQPDLPPQAPGDDSYHTELPPLKTPTPHGKGPDAGGEGESGIPATVLAAYKKAEDSLAGSDPSCALPWELLAAIGKVESGQARGGAVDANGTTLKPILGPVLNGSGFAEITDTDRGVYDGDTTYDRAIGPMQFIPSTWATWGADGNGDGRQDPNNIFDAALAAGEYLCAGERDLTVKVDLDRAILSYNQSREYLNTVLEWLDFYRRGVQEVPDGKGPLPTSPGPGGRDDSRGDGRDDRLPGGREGGDGDGRSREPSHKPGGQSSDKPHRPGGNSQSPTPPPSESPTDPPTTPTPTPTHPAALERVGDTEVTATAGSDFRERLRVRAEDSGGKAVDDVEVRFAIVGTTDAHFSGGATKADVTTGTDGTATAPVLVAGERTGDFVVRATVVGRDVPAADFTATVKARPAPTADALALAPGATLETVAGGVFAEGSIEILATKDEQSAAQVPLSATMVTKEGKPATTGPYFVGTDDEPLRSLTGLKTDVEGKLKLPEIRTDRAHEGTYYLRVATDDDVALTLKLTVTAPAA